MTASGFGSAAKFMPLPTMSRVRAASSGRAPSAVARLNAMTEPASKVRERGSDVVGPHRVRVLLGDPWLRLLELLRRRRQGDAVREVGAPIAEREQLGPEEVG